MALRLESDPDAYDNVVSPERVLPDLALKLPNLFGPGADTTFKHILTQPDVTISVGSSHYPKDYVHMNAHTGQRMSPLYVYLRDLFGNEDRWSVEVAGAIEKNNGFLVEWIGRGDSRAYELAIRWPYTLPSFHFDMEKGLVTAANSDRGMEPLALEEMVRRTDRSSEWLKRVHDRTSVRMDDLVIDPEQNTLTANLVWQFRSLPVFPIRIPFMADANRTWGITSKSHRLYAHRMT